MNNYQDLLSAAKDAATKAGEYAKASTAMRHEANKVTSSDVKHKLDVACEKIAVETLRSHFPSSRFLGEEGTEEAAEGNGLEWIIDPIDGTVNFFHGNYEWCCSIAARVDGKVVAGAVYAPEVGLMFEATADGPALCNGRELHVSATDRLDRAMVHTGADKDSDETRTRAYRFFTAIADRIQRPRVMGAAALDICMVAAGWAEAFFEPGIYIWDIAAAALIVERAGGKSEIMWQLPSGKLAFLGSNGILHEPLKNIVNDVVKNR